MPEEAINMHPEIQHIIWLLSVTRALFKVGAAQLAVLMQGEMSATVFYYPASYVQLIPDLKQRLAAGQASASNIRIGVSTNFDKLCGCVLQACPPVLILMANIWPGSMLLHSPCPSGMPYAASCPSRAASSRAACSLTRTSDFCQACMQEYRCMIAILSHAGPGGPYAVPAAVPCCLRPQEEPV